MPRQLRRRAPSDQPEDQWAEFADHVLEIAREIQVRGYTSPEAVSLTSSEGTVMRYLFRHPGALPSEVASATGLQRSNLSAVLRGLEEKGLVEHTVEGRSFIYRPLYSREKTVSRFVQRVFDGALDQLVMSALSAKKLSRQEIAAIEAVIAGEKKRQGM